MKKRIKTIIALAMMLTMLIPSAWPGVVMAEENDAANTAPVITEEAENQKTEAAEEAAAGEEEQAEPEKALPDEAGKEEPSEETESENQDTSEDMNSEGASDEKADKPAAKNPEETHEDEIIQNGSEEDKSTDETENSDSSPFKPSKGDLLSYDPLYISRYADSDYADVSSMDMTAFYNIVSSARGVATYNVRKQADFRITEENYIAGLPYQMPVYDVDPDGKYYLAIPDVNKFASGFREYDIIVAYNNDYGETISGCVYKNGILYIPKKAIDRPANRHDIPRNTPIGIQINYAIGGDMDFSKSVPVQILDGSEPDEKKVRIDNMFLSDSLDVSTGIRGRKDSDVSVYMNGSLIPANRDSWEYDSGSGKVSVSTCPGVISNINIVFKPRGLKDKLTSAVGSFMGSVASEAYAAGKVSMDDMKFFRTKNGKAVTLDIPAEKLFVGWRGYYSGKRVHGTTTNSSTHAKLMACTGWEDSIKYMYGGYDSQAYVDGSDQYVAKHMAATWAFSSYASAYNVDPDGSGGSIDSSTDKIKYWNNKTKQEESKTIYEWLLNYRNDLELSKDNTGVNSNGTMANNGLGGVNNFAFTLPKKVTGASTSLVSSGEDKNRKNTSFSMKSDELEASSGSGDTNNYYDYWVCASCNHLDKAEADEGNSNKIIYVTCLGIGSDYAVLAFVQSGAAGSQNACGIYKFGLAPSGYARLKKTASESTMLKNAPNNYTLAGAKYKLYKDSACTQGAVDVKGREAVLTTDSKGDTNTLEMLPGSYYAREVTASKGFKTDTRVNNGRRIDITTDSREDEPYVITSTEEPSYGIFNVKLYKQNDDYGYNRLLNAEYTLSYYDIDAGYADGSNGVPDISGKTPLKKWVFRTRAGKDGDGKNVAMIDFAVDTPVSGGQMFKSGNSTILPNGVFTLQETKAPPGVGADQAVYKGTVRQKSNGGASQVYLNGSALMNVVNIDSSFRLVNTEPPKSVLLKLQKVDESTGEPQPEGAERDYSKGSLAGAVYEVYMEDTDYADDVKVGVITTDENGYGELSKDAHRGNAPLKAGKYYIKEIKASPGYVTDDASTPEKRGEYEDGRHIVLARLDQSGSKLIYDFEIRSADPHHVTTIRKTDITDGSELPGAKLQVINSDGNTVDEWISSEKPHDILALPDGKYILREITAPYGYDIAEDVEFEVRAGEISSTVEMKNRPVNIGTTALDDSTGSHSGIFSNKDTITDKVALTGLYAGRKYKVTGKLIDRSTGEAVGEETSVEFTADAEEMTVDLKFELDSSSFSRDTTCVAYEKLYRTAKVHDEEVPAELQKHENPDDEDQSVHYGGIVSTTALGKESGSHNILAGKNTVIKDTVRYSNLSVRDRYTLQGEIYDKTTGKLTGITSTKTFTPESPSGTVELDFRMDTRDLRNHRLVVFETLLINKTVIDKHAEPDDEDQTVNVPAIRTQAADPGSGEQIINAGPKMTVRDTVSYSNLRPGRTYTITGTLNYKGGALGGLHTVSRDGKALTAETTFTPKEASGTETVTFEFDGEYLAGKKIVVFEELYDGKALIAEHADLEDEAQAVYVPEIRTKVGRKNGNTVRDTVIYKNLIPGRTYRIKGYFVRKSDGKRIEGSDGEVVFTPDKKDGKIDVELKPGKGTVKLVAFESVYLEKVTENEAPDEDTPEILVGEHKDLTDSAQTYSPISSPKTGDNNNLKVYMIITVLAGMALLYVYMIRKAQSRF